MTMEESVRENERPMIREIVMPEETSRNIDLKLRAIFDGRNFAIDRDWKEMKRIAATVLENLTSAQTLAQLQENTPETIVTVLRNGTRIGALQPTPLTGFANDSELAAADAALLGVLALRGIVPHAYPFENEGRLARNVVPRPEFSDTDSSWGSRAALAWHQDNNFQPFEFDLHEKNSASPQTARKTTAPMPRYLAFVALRNHEGAPTQVLAMDDVLRRLDPAVITALQEKAFTVDAPHSARENRPIGAGDGEVMPLLIDRDGCVCSRFDMSEGVHALTATAQRALEALRAAVTRAADKALSVQLSPGDMLIFDNYRVMHRRDAFTPHSTWEGRWLRRVYGLSSAFLHAGKESN